MIKLVVVVLAACLFASTLAHSHKYKPQDPREELHRRKTLAKRDREASTREEVNYHLPTSAVPTSYYIRLLPFVNGNHSINGYEEMRFDILEATSTVTFHIRDIQIDESTITLTRQDDLSSVIPVVSTSYDIVTDFYVVTLDSELEVGVSYQMTLSYVANLSDLLSGFYRSTYEDETGTVINIGTSHFESTDARRAFPCFDEPALKATFEIEMGREVAYGSISNMPKVSTNEIEGLSGYVWDKFEPSVPMSSYLVAFVVSDFVSMSSTSENGVLFRVWAQEVAIDQAAYALETGPIVLTFFEEYFDVPFPLPKQDMIALPDFAAGAMENWGLITYRETAMLFDALVGSANDKQRVTQVVAHELGHMWFGDLVTLYWWNDLWLNEGFATYAEYLGMDDAEPGYLAQEQYVTNDLQPIFRTDALESTHPLRVDVNNPNEISDIFDGITYSKGSAVIRMMNYFLSEQVFREGITNYLTGLSYSSATQDDLWNYLDQAAQANQVLPDGVSVNDIMNTWTLQGGFPLVNVTINGDGTALVSQNRFLTVDSETAEQYQWWIPLTYQSNTSPDFTQTMPQKWMSNEEAEVTISDLDPEAAWTIFNVQQVSFYRVNYDAANWQALGEQLSVDHEVIDVRNRAQLLDDSLNIARADKLSYDVPFSLSSYLLNEHSYTPWDTALSSFSFIEEMFTRTSGYQNLKKYLLSFIVPLYEFVGFEDDLSDDHTIQLLRSLGVSWACDLKYQPCLDLAVENYAGWMLTPDNFASVSPNLKSAVYCTAIAEGGQAEWDFAWDRYQTTDLASEQAVLLYALGCSQDIPTLSRYLELAFTEGSGIRQQDSYQAYYSVSNNDVGRDLAWDYLLNNYEAITVFYGYDSILQSMASTASSEFNTQSELLELKAFSKIIDPGQGGSTQVIDGAIEGVESNISWMEKNYDYIVSWLESNVARTQ